MPPEERAAIRKTRAKPIFDALEDWQHAQLPKISGKSPLAQAIRYALGRIPKAQPYLGNGHLELDNNTADRAVKPVAIGRKMDVRWLKGRRQSHGNCRDPHRNRQAQQGLPPSLAHMGARPNHRSQNHTAGRAYALALRR
jgi:hypothetical protein